MPTRTTPPKKKAPAKGRPLVAAPKTSGKAKDTKMAPSSAKGIQAFQKGTTTSSAKLASQGKQGAPPVSHNMKTESKVMVKPTVKQAASPPPKAVRKKTSTSVNNMAAANEVQKQKDAFEKANKLFHARSFSDALKMFQQAAAGPSIEISHVAKLHTKMCEQRVQKETIPLETPEDKYNYAISLLNQKTNLDDAEKFLRAAVQARETADHYHYALALCLGLKGDFAGSGQHLSRAIALAPTNRAMAKNDPDFREILQSPVIRELFQNKPS